VIDDLPRREGLEVADFLRDIRRRGNQVKVIFEDDIAVDGEAAVRLEKVPRVVEELHGLGACEYRKPADDRAC
jgi:hypothetical protein